MRAAVLILLAASRLASATSDLRLDLATLSTGINVELKYFPGDACELQPADLCVGAPGARKLLRFNVFAVNQGPDDLVLGEARDGDPMWVYSQCHRHFHFESFARYELHPHAGGPVIHGQKRSFCVEDTRSAGATSSARYCCRPTDSCAIPGTQGIQVGWGDLYANTLPCQWIDITDDVPPGDYDLCVYLNTEHVLPDPDASNDQGCVPITIAGPPARAGTPKVKVRAPRARPARRVGRALRIMWQAHLRGRLLSQEIWFSRDGGASYELIAGGPDVPHHRYAWSVPADAVTDQARVKVIAWSRFPANGEGAGSLLRGVGESAPFRIVP